MVCVHRFFGLFLVFLGWCLCIVGIAATGLSIRVWVMGNLVFGVIVLSPYQVCIVSWVMVFSRTLLSHFVTGSITLLLLLRLSHYGLLHFDAALSMDSLLTPSLRCWFCVWFTLMLLLFMDTFLMILLGLFSLPTFAVSVYGLIAWFFFGVYWSKDAKDMYSVIN